MIIDAWGEIIAQLNEGNGAVQVDFNIASLQKVRKQMPVLQHNRFSCTQKFK